MNTEFFDAMRPAAERVGWVLVHSTWQGAAVAAALWVALAAMGKRSAPRRYMACCVALAAVVVAMAVTFARVEGARRVAVTAGESGLPAAVDLRVGDVPIPPAAVDPARTESKSTAAAASWDVKDRIAPWLPAVAAAWAAGVAGLALWHLGGWVRVRRMTRAGTAGAWDEPVGELARRMGVSRGVRVVESVLAGVPAVVGFLRPVILLPVGLAAEMSAGQVEAILLHELAHVRRNDYLVNLVQTAVETLLFYHPAVWWISAQVRQEREHCCDDLAITACNGDRAGYARALARVEEIRGTRLPLAAAADGGSLLHRVRRIAGVQPHVPPAGRATPLAAALAVVGALLAAAAVQWPARAADPPPATRPATRPVVRPDRWGNVRDPLRKYVNIVVGRDRITLGGKPTDAAGIERALRAIPSENRASTEVAVWAAAGDVPVGRFLWVLNRCQTLRQDLGLASVHNAGVQPPPYGGMMSPATKPAPRVGEYYVEGRVAHPSTYSLNGVTIRLSQAIVSAGIPLDGGATYATVIRREGDRRVARAENVVIKDLFEKRVEDIAIRPSDLVRVSAEKLPPFGRAADIRPAPHAGEVGEVYVGGYVRRPGVYSVRGQKVTVGQIQAAAGGLDSETADETVIVRREGDRETQVRVSIRNLLNGTEPDLELQPGDRVSFGVPPRPADAARK